MTHPAGQGTGYECMEVGSDGRRLATQIFEPLRREMQHFTLGVGDCRGGVRLISIQADLAQHGPLEKGPEPNLLSVASFEEHRDPPGHDEKDAGCGLALPHELTPGGDDASGQVRGELIGEPSGQRPLLSVAHPGDGEKTVLGPGHTVIEVDLIPYHVLIISS